METLYFVTGNQNKLNEAEIILNRSLKLFKADLVEIQNMDLQKVVEQKAQHAYQIVKQPVFVDDVGFYMGSWNGFPGPFVKFLFDAGGNELILKMLGSETDRSVTVKAGIGFYDGIQVRSFIGEIKGEIVNKPRGENGWGFDPILQPDGYSKTFGEMTEQEKNSISYRKNALTQFAEFLKTYSLS